VTAPDLTIMRDAIREGVEQIVPVVGQLLVAAVLAGVVVGCLGMAWSLDVVGLGDVDLVVP